METKKEIKLDLEPVDLDKITNMAQMIDLLDKLYTYENCSACINCKYLKEPICYGHEERLKTCKQQIYRNYKG